MSTNVSILAEIPEDLHLSMQGYLEGNPDWDQDRIFSAAISLFLLQNTVENTPEASLNYRRAARVYLETLFRDDTETPEVSSTQCEDSDLSKTQTSDVIDSVDPLATIDGLTEQAEVVATPIESQPAIELSSDTDDVSIHDSTSLDSPAPQDPQGHVDAA